jgi:hypothetical protein
MSAEHGGVFAHGIDGAGTENHRVGRVYVNVCMLTGRPLMHRQCALY